MELRHLRYFVAVAEELHFGRAAERLCISQPPLSQQIQQLERELGFALFARTKRRVELTPAGRLYLEEVYASLDSLEQAATEGRRIARGEVGWLGIGFVGTATYGVLPRALSVFRSRFPDVRLVLRELVTARQLQSLLDHRIHVGLARPGIADSRVDSKVVISEPFVAALPKGHSLCRFRRIPLDALSEEPFVLFPRQPRPSYADTVVSACNDAGFQPRVEQEVAEIHTAIGIVSAGVGVTLVPACVRSAHREGVVFCALTQPSPVSDLEVACLRDQEAPAVRQFVDIVLGECRSHQTKDRRRPI